MLHSVDKNDRTAQCQLI